MSNPKLVFLSNMAAPYQVKFCEALQKFYKAKFWFYVHLEKDRPEFWKIPLGEHCEILESSKNIPFFGYFNYRVFKKLNDYNPDIIIMGGFFIPMHVLVLLWAKINKKKIVFYTETLELNRFLINPFLFKIKRALRQLTLYLFRPTDRLFAMGSNVVDQFINIYHFPPEKVKLTRYPQDIDSHLSHEPRNKKKGDSLLILFPGRLEEAYNPLFAIEVFKAVVLDYPQLKMRMNAHGALRQQCEELIAKFQLQSSIQFIDGIKNWNDLHLIYKAADIVFIPAKNSNGPNTLIEGMASGMGVVISDQILNVNEYLIHEQNGFILPLSIESMKKGLEEYINNPTLIDLHGKISKANVQKRSASGTAELYHQLISEIYPN
jgi:glycosyltransferase involved in cell wall biosynthesis